MPESLSLLFYAFAAVLFLCAFGAGWLTALTPVSPRKARVKLLAYASVGLAFIALGIPMLTQHASERPLPFAGTITSVHQAGGKATYSTLQVQLKNGCMLTLHSSRKSKFFRAGQAVEGHYTHIGGNLVSARFLSKEGTQQGTFSNRMLPMLPWGSVLLGALFLVAGWLLYRHDPTGAKLAPPQN